LAMMVNTRQLNQRDPSYRSVLNQDMVKPGCHGCDGVAA